MKKFQKLSLLALAAVGIIYWNRPTVLGQENASSSREDLQQQIQNKSQELEDINKKLGAVQQNLETTKSQRQTLQNQLSNLQRNINQLNLNIRADNVASQKLNLEIESLNYDLTDIESSVNDKKDAVVKILREFQKNDENNLLIIFLRNGNLSDSFLETQSLINLKTSLSEDIASLTSLHQQLSDKAQQIDAKKNEVELHKENLKIRSQVIQDQKSEQQVILTQTKDKESIYQQQLNDLKKQQDAVSDEISKIEDQLRASFNVGLLPQKIHGILAWPLSAPIRITQHYGEISYLYRGKPHNGTDLAASIATPVFAADRGTVMAVGNNDVSRWRKYQYGKYILVKHSNNLATLYAHLSTQIVRAGDTVDRGQLIGYSDTTGYATGPHLHFGLYWAPSIIMKSIPPAADLVPVGVTINPEDYLPLP